MYATSAELLALFNDLTGRADADSIPSTKKYTWLARAEKEVVSKIATVRPEVLFPSTATALLPTMTGDANNNVFTFGVDGSGNAIQPLYVEVYRNLTDIPDTPYIPYYDLLPEGDHIRLPRNRTFGGTLYWRGLVMPADISATEPGHLVPREANELTALRAAKNFAQSGNIRNAALADRMERQFAQRFAEYCLLWKRQYSKGGALVGRTLRDLSVVLH